MDINEMHRSIEEQQNNTNFAIGKNIFYDIQLVIGGEHSKYFILQRGYFTHLRFKVSAQPGWLCVRCPQLVHRHHPTFHVVTIADRRSLETVLFFSEC